MGDDLAGAVAPRYRAFVSYSHADTRVASWLHRKLESAHSPDNQRLFPVFIDRAELAAGPDLSAQVRDALAQSAALVVVASPAARASRWVGQEIKLFRQLHPDRPILAVLIDGEPGEAFPDALLSNHGASIEPLAADFRKGQDGKRLGLLKIVAGLTAQPLDRLVQRDAQTRQRRVMAVTAGALLLSLVLSAALLLAIRARTEAERQRADAEGLVEFMLTDLRDKLKGVGRLDVMDAVNQRVLQRYSGDSALEGLPDDILLRRAGLLQAMAEDDLSSQNYFERGAKEAEAANRITLVLVQRSPQSAVAILAHAKSEFWIGQAKFQNPRQQTAQRRAAAEPHWQNYRRLTANLALRPDAKTEWLVESSYAEGNLCALAMTKPTRPQAALNHCAAASRNLEAAQRLRSDDLDIGLNLATAYAWQADAYAATGREQSAIATRERQSQLVDRLATTFPDDWRVTEARLLADFGQARMFFRLRRFPEARNALTRAEAQAKRLQAHDPGNGDWSKWLKQIADLRKQLS